MVNMLPLSNTFANNVLYRYVMYHLNTPVLTFSRDGDYLYDIDIIQMHLLPEQLKFREGVLLSQWLSQRSLDTSRSNARRLINELGLRMNPISIVLFNKAMCITDTYAILGESKPYDYYADHIRFINPDNGVISLSTSGTSLARFERKENPELTAIGSFDKAWVIYEGEWWLYKRGNRLNMLGELVAQKLCNALGLKCAEYIACEGGVKSRNFADTYSLEHYASYAYIGDPDADPHTNLPAALYQDYCAIKFIDAVICNADRHEFNFGVLKNINGDVVSMAPNFDNNLSLGASQPLGMAMLKRLETPVPQTLVHAFLALDIATLLKSLGLPKDVLEHLTHTQTYIASHW